MLGLPRFFVICKEGRGPLALGGRSEGTRRGHDV
jgi:hypothetical protein